MVAVQCEKCGEDNPDHAVNCGSCLEPLKPAGNAVGSEPTQPSQHPSFTPLAPAEKGLRTGAGSREFTIATWLAATGLLLTLISMVLYVYYYESIWNHDFDYDSFRRRYDIMRASMYTGAFGWIIVVSAVVLAVKGLVAQGWKSASSTLKAVNPRLLLMMLFVILAVLSFAAIVMVATYEFGDEMDYDMARILSRLYLYSTLSMPVLESALVLMVMKSLRRATK